MKYKTNIILILFILLITSCSQKIPKYGSGEAETVFVIPTKGKNTSSYPFLFNFRFDVRVFDHESSNDLDVVGTITIIPKRGLNFETLTDLPPGRYEIFRYKILPAAQYNYNFRYPKAFIDFKYPFTLDKSSITVAEIYAYVSQLGVKDGRSSSTSGEFKLDKTVKNEVIEMIKKDENFEGWKIYGEE